MKLINNENNKDYFLYCPRCGKKLGYESDMKFMFCRYCGTRIELTGMNNNDQAQHSSDDDFEEIMSGIDRIAEHGKDYLRIKKEGENNARQHKERMSVIQGIKESDALSHEEIIRRQEYEHEREIMQHKERMITEKNAHERFLKENAKNRKQGCFSSLLRLPSAILFVIGVLLIGMFTFEPIERFQRQKEEEYQTAVHLQEVERLTAIEQEVYVLMNEGKYDEALLKANMIHYAAPYNLISFDADDKWDERRENLIEAINTAKGVTPATLPEVKNLGTTPNWPKSALGKAIPDPGTKQCEVSWENDNGFVATVRPYTRSQYDDYVDACWELGYTKKLDKTENVFRATNALGYRLNLEFESGDAMWIRMDK